MGKSRIDERLARERARRQKRKNFLKLLIVVLCIGANVALVIYRAEVVEWARDTFGTITIHKESP